MSGIALTGCRLLVARDAASAAAAAVIMPPEMKYAHDRCKGRERAARPVDAGPGVIL